MSAVAPDRAFERLAELAFAGCFILGLSLAVLGAATGMRWLSANWSTACHRLLHTPTPPNFAAPWRLTNLRLATPCLNRRP